MIKGIKTVFVVSLLLMLFHVVSAQTVTQVWTTDTILPIPESVLPLPGKDLLYVSHIDGNPAEKDGKGSIGKLTRDGKIIQVNWVTGLSAPKGMGIYGNTLYVADIDEVVAIDVVSGKVKQRIGVKGATFLNDITIDAGGLIYVSDSRSNKVFVIANGKPATLEDKIQNANGLLWQPEGLYMLSAGKLLFRNNAGQITTIAEGMLPSTDGIERVNGKDFVVSCWSGALYLVTLEGKVNLLLDTQQEKMNTADIGYDDKTKTIFVPTFFTKTVRAYKLNLPE